MCYYLLPTVPDIGAVRLDVFGAITITTALLLAVYAIVNGNAAGWLSLQTVGMFSAAILLFVLFVYIKSKVQQPLVPMSIFRIGNITSVSIIGILWSVAMFAWFFMTALYLQLVLRYTPMEVGLAFLPPNLIMAAFSWGLSAKMVMRFGTKLPIVFGMSSDRSWSSPFHDSLRSMLISICMCFRNASARAGRWGDIQSCAPCWNE